MSQDFSSILTQDYKQIRSTLEAEGWNTPQTYCNCFDEAGDFPAVYVFLLVDPLHYKTARPAYVGMSTRLSQRWMGHSILAELEEVGPWVQQWFLKTPKAELRAVEAQNIARFDPPWNVIGRRRGVLAL